MSVQVGSALRLLAIFQGWYGERIVRHVASLAGDWEVHSVQMRKGLPPIPEEREEEALLDELIRRLPRPYEADLLLFLAEEAGAFLLLPELVQRLDVRAVIGPVDDYGALPRGLEKQLSEELEEIGVIFAFPRPFCSLSGGDGPVGVFSERFGAPRLEVELDGDVIRAVRVLRGSPCGSTYYMARRLVGAEVEKAPSLAGLYVQTYPCLASHVEDPLIGEDLIHVSASLAKAAVEKAILRARARQAHGAGAR